MGDCMYSQANLQNCIDYLEEALKKKPDYNNVTITLSTKMVEIMYSNLKKYQEQPETCGGCEG